VSPYRCSRPKDVSIPARPVGKQSKVTRSHGDIEHFTSRHYLHILFPHSRQTCGWTDVPGQTTVEIMTWGNVILLLLVIIISLHLWTFG
jgi:hypothetical protein